MATFVGVDLGGTTIKAGLVDKKGIIKHIEIPTEANKGKIRVTNNIISSIKEVIRKDTSAIGIGSPGPLDIKNGIILNTPNLPLNGVNIVEIIEKRFRKKTILDNDANCFAFAEAKFGKCRGKKIVLGITLGTGFGSGLVINKRIYHGSGNAIEVGHTSIKYDGPVCTCGNHGCVEEFVSIRALLKYAKPLEVKDTLSLYNLAKQGNKNAIDAFKRFGYYLGVALSNFANTFDPEIIVVGGNVSKSWKFFSEPMFSELKTRSLFKPCEVVKSELEEPGILGAACLVMK